MPPRLVKKFSSIHPVFWFCMLTLWMGRSLQSETEPPDIDLCQDEGLSDLYPWVQWYRESSSGQMQLVDEEEEYDDEEANVGKFSCVLHPTKTLICSVSCWSFQNNSQYSASVIICEGEKRISSWQCLPAEIRASEQERQPKSLVLCKDTVDYNISSVILQVNVSLPQELKIYTFKYVYEILEVLSPPPNISASIRERALLVTWDIPYTPSSRSPKCFKYQLDISGQDRHKNVTKHLKYTEPNIDPTQTYKVRLRTRKDDECLTSHQWSDWSDIIKVAPTESLYKLNYIVIITILLGIPMILLVVLLLVRIQRESELLFPPIPRPPLKYKQFLEKHNAFYFRPPVQPPQYVEEITEVEEADGGGKSF
ncbi:uncharacterized protein ACJ7VT_017026 [Polymixia lowei]